MTATLTTGGPRLSPKRWSTWCRALDMVRGAARTEAGDWIEMPGARAEQFR